MASRYLALYPAEATTTSEALPAAVVGVSHVDRNKLQGTTSERWNPGMIHENLSH